MLETTPINFRKNFESEVARCLDNHETLKVKRDSGENFIIIGESDWISVEEILYLTGFRDWFNVFGRPQKNLFQKECLWRNLTGERVGYFITGCCERRKET